ncbi:3-hydroxyacyl-CoA dehydrogenase [Limtongia smithiae]|uniref:3-hydroxyacyl-CoA dehydrogenase n=1 Tax=Limtongia smithiae TaxID=1125753 RepID=UPI0034CEF23A
MAATDTIALVGLGSIGISFAAVHLLHSAAQVRVFDPRPDLEHHLHAILPAYLGADAGSVSALQSAGRLIVCTTLAEACASATVVQEQGPENLTFKTQTWAAIEAAAPADAALWTSTSGIPAHVQAALMHDPSRLVVVHPFNPPHVLPLLEICGGTSASAEAVSHAQRFFPERLPGAGFRPVIVRAEVPGFVGNRLAFVLFREACALVAAGVVDDVAALDAVVEASLGPRWAVQGPFRAYNMGGGSGGLQAFVDNLAGTIDAVWQDADMRAGDMRMREEGGEFAPWVAGVIAQAQSAYGTPTVEDLAVRDRALRRVLHARMPEMDEMARS